MACLLLFFFRSEIGLHRPIVCLHIIINTTEDKVVAVPSQAAAPTLVIKPPSPVSLTFQAMVPPMLLVLVKLALGPSTRLLPHARGHRR